MRTDHRGYSTRHLSALLCAGLVAACTSESGDPEMKQVQEPDGAAGAAGVGAPGTRAMSVLLSSGKFAGPLEIARKHEASGWQFDMKSSSDLVVAVHTVTFGPGQSSGWHNHHGPVFITVVAGTMTFYDSDDPSCQPTVRTAGQGFLDGATEHAHIARNETDQPAQNVIVYMAAAATPLRIDMPQPPNCPSF